MIIPSIDLRGGRVVQLRQGSETILTDCRHPVDLARQFHRFGPVAVVDLDAALGTGNNAELVRTCCRAVPCRVGGGIRSEEDVRQLIRWGAEKVIIGTQATPEFLQRFPREWLVAAIDAKHGEVVVEGWQRPTGTSISDAATALAPYCSELLYTCVEREGMLGGAALQEAIALAKQVSVPLTVAGGISSTDEISTLVAAGCNAQLGRALYEERIDLADAWVDQIAFGDHGLVPTIVQDNVSNEVLMLAYSNADSLRTALRTGQGWYYSRSRRELWRKGATSGNTQELVSARWDCDRDGILFRVNQTGPACHTGASACFPAGCDAVLRSLDATIESRAKQGDAASYTRRLLDDDEKMIAKLREETQEIIEATSDDHVAWEAADVIYHLLVLARSRGVSLQHIRNELRSRMR